MRSRPVCACAASPLPGGALAVPAAAAADRLVPPVLEPSLYARCLRLKCADAAPESDELASAVSVMLGVVVVWVVTVPPWLATLHCHWWWASATLTEDPLLKEVEAAAADTIQAPTIPLSCEAIAIRR